MESNKGLALLWGYKWICVVEFLNFKMLNILCFFFEGGREGGSFLCVLYRKMVLDMREKERETQSFINKILRLNYFFFIFILL
jgi:hypothetical protein